MCKKNENLFLSALWFDKVRPPMAFQYYFVLGFEAIGAANRGLIWYQSVCQVSAQKKDICFPLQQPLDVQLVGFQACGTRQVLLVPRLTSFFGSGLGTLATWCTAGSPPSRLGRRKAMEEESSRQNPAWSSFPINQATSSSAWLALLQRT